MPNFEGKNVPTKVLIPRTELIMQLNSEAEKYNTVSKEVMLNNQKDLKGWKYSVLHHF